MHCTARTQDQESQGREGENMDPWRANNRVKSARIWMLEGYRQQKKLQELGMLSFGVLA